MKIFRIYIITAVLCMSVMLVAAGVFIADDSAKKISMGSEQSVAAICVGDRFENDNTIDIEPFLKKIETVIVTTAEILF